MDRETNIQSQRLTRRDLL